MIPFRDKGGGSMSLAESFKAVSDPQRRQVLTFLRGGRRTAGEIAEALGISASALSYHLSALKKADMLIEYKVKNYVYYELNTTLFDEMLLWMDQFRRKGAKE